MESLSDLIFDLTVKGFHVSFEGDERKIRVALSELEAPRRVIEHWVVTWEAKQARNDLLANVLRRMRREVEALVPASA